MKVPYATILLLTVACAASKTAQTAEEASPASPTVGVTSGAVGGEEFTVDSTRSAIRSPAAVALAEYRREAIRKLRADPRGPLDSAGVFDLRFFAYNDTFDLAAVFRPSTDTTLFRFPTSDGGTRAYRTFGKLIFRVSDELYSLDVFELPGLQRHPLYFDHLFLPFFDATNGEQTYGGGRYIDLERSAFAKGDYRLDFNKAYNPWCAYAEGYSCPVPPASNALPFAVYAGEAAFAKTHDGVPHETP